VTLEEIRKEVKVWANEPDYDQATVNGYINEAYQYVCAEVNIPDQKKFDVVSTVPATAYVSLSTMTGGFSGRLTKAWFRPNATTDYADVGIKSSLEKLMEEYPEMDEVGDVEYVALEGSTLWLQPIPSVAGTLRIVYYQNPTLLTTDTSTPSILPVHLHRPLLVDGACWIIWDSIEQAEDGSKPNTDRHWAKFDRGIGKLREYIAARRRHYISSMWGE